MEIANIMQTFPFSIFAVYALLAKLENESAGRAQFY